MSILSAPTPTATTKVVPKLVPFLGDDLQATYQDAQVVILPIPYEATTTYRQGCQFGPEELLTASHQVEIYDDELEREIGLEVAIHTHGAIADTRSQTVPDTTMLAVTKQTVAKLIADGKFVIALGGEHSITGPIVEAYLEAHQEPFTVVQIDAHGDLRHEYEGSIYNHACVMRRVVDMGLPTVQIGIRSVCKEEAELIKAKHLPIIWARDIASQPDWMEQVFANITTKKVFLTIDLDGIDPTLIPGVGTPEPGGLSWFAFLTMLRRLFKDYEVIGSDIMELAPIVDSVVSQFTAAKLAYKLVGYQALAQGWQ